MAHTTQMAHADHDRILRMIETMQREGELETAIHDAVRRATRGARDERSRGRRRGVLRVFRRRHRRSR